MKNRMLGLAVIACAFTMIGWGSTSGDNYERDRGNAHAEKSRQNDDENIKRAQGNSSGERDVHEQGALENDNRGRW